MQKRLAFGICILIAVAIVVLHGQSSLGRWRETFLVNNGVFQIRARMFPDQGFGVVLGATYVYDAAPLDSEDWHVAGSWHRDDPDPIAPSRIRFVKDDTAYVFDEYHYATSTDRGKNWQQWAIATDFPRWKDHRATIADVTLKSDGAGEMKLRQIDPTSPKRLITTDYGRHWQQPQ